MSKPASAFTIMGAALDRELQDRGIFSLGRGDCEAIITRVIERSAAVEPQLSRRAVRPALFGIKWIDPRKDPTR